MTDDITVDDIQIGHTADVRWKKENIWKIKFFFQKFLEENSEKSYLENIQGNRQWHRLSRKFFLKSTSLQ